MLLSKLWLTWRCLILFKLGSPVLSSGPLEFETDDAISNRQQPLLKPFAGPESSNGFRRGDYAKHKQDGDVCKTYGENQWTGTVDVADERRLFYYFFDSRNDPENDPIIVWMNGGPGGSSMKGLFTTIGPCLVTKDSNDTVANPYAWNNNASVLFIDQPAGTGLSSVAPGARYPDTDDKSSSDLAFFLYVFFEKIFPERAKLPLHLAGESYGGHYVPAVVNHILQQRRYESRFAVGANISSVVLVNALIDWSAPYVGAWHLLCSDFRGQILNESACDALAAAIPECEKLAQDCRRLGGPNTCRAAFTYCRTAVDSFYQAEIEAGRRSRYNINLPCTDIPFCWDVTEGNYSTYVSQPRILSKLGLPPDFYFQAANRDLNSGFIAGGSAFKSRVPDVVTMLESSTAVLVLNGNEDYLVNTPAQMIVYDSLPWAGQASYRAAPWQPLAKKQGFWKRSKDRKLTFIGIDGAGHAAPADQKALTDEIIRAWISSGNIGE